MKTTPEILYEDNHILVAVKPVGVLSQADNTGDDDMLTLLKTYIKEKYSKPGNVFLGLVHRLDRMTGGVMVFARTSKAASRLGKAILEHEFVKKYVALVDGHLSNVSGRLEDYLVTDETTGVTSVGSDANGKLAILEYEVLSYVDDKTLISVHLHTGRHHQIRVQFANIGHPLVGDVLYGKQVFTNLRLFANYLAFPHPITHEKLTFEVELPACFKCKVL